MTDTLQIDAATKARLKANIELDVDPTGSTPEVKVDSVWYPAVWLGAPVEDKGVWYQSARTTGYFAGPQVVSPAGATVLGIGPHKTKTRVTNGLDIMTAESTTLVVLTSA